jgi:hypothetical protein
MFALSENNFMDQGWGVAGCVCGEERKGPPPIKKRKRNKCSVL